MGSLGLSSAMGAAGVRRAAARLLVPAAIVALAAALVSLLVVGPTPAAAHTDLLQASPGPGQRAGGDIDFVDLAFLEPVSGAAVAVAHNGETVPGSTTVTEGSIIRFVFDEPLTSPGSYEVSYEMISYDLDQTTGGFSFTFEPEAPQARQIGTVEPEGRNWFQIIATGVLILALAAAAFLFLARLEAKRRVAGESPDRDERQVDR